MKTKKEISAGPVLWGGRGKEEIVLLPSDVPYNRQVSGDGVGGNIQGSEECTAAPWPTELREIGIKGPCNPQPWTQVGGGGLGLAAQAGQRAGTVYKTEQPGTLLKKKKKNTAGAHCGDRHNAGGASATTSAGPRHHLQRVLTRREAGLSHSHHIRWCSAPRGGEAET